MDKSRPNLKKNGYNNEIFDGVSVGLLLVIYWLKEKPNNWQRTVRQL